MVMCTNKVASGIGSPVSLRKRTCRKPKTEKFFIRKGKEKNDYNYSNTLHTYLIYECVCV